MHAMAVAGSNTSSSSSPGPPATPAMQQPQQGQSQPQSQAQVAQAARLTFPQQVKGFGPPSQAYMNMSVNMNPAPYGHLAAKLGPKCECGWNSRTTSAIPHNAGSRSGASSRSRATASCRTGGHPHSHAGTRTLRRPNGPNTSCTTTATATETSGATLNPYAYDESRRCWREREPPSDFSFPIPAANGQGLHVSLQHFAASVPVQQQQLPQRSKQQPVCLDKCGSFPTASAEGGCLGSWPWLRKRRLDACVAATPKATPCL